MGFEQVSASKIYIYNGIFVKFSMDFLKDDCLCDEQISCKMCGILKAYSLYLRYFGM